MRNPQWLGVTEAEGAGEVRWHDAQAKKRSRASLPQRSRGGSRGAKLEAAMVSSTTFPKARPTLVLPGVRALNRRAHSICLTHATFANWRHFLETLDFNKGPAMMESWRFAFGVLHQASLTSDSLGGLPLDHTNP
jgi:hypothetical protein